MKLMAVFALGCVLALRAGPAFAADELGLSRDHVHWSPNLTTPLFGPSFLWVPGDTETASFWVRNQSHDQAMLEVAVLGASLDSLIHTGDLSITVKAAGGPPTSTRMAGRQVLVSSRPVDPGEDQRIDVTVAFDPAATNQSQVKSLDLQFEVRLTQETVPPGGSDGSDDSDSDSDGSDASNDESDHGLPGTGSSMRPVWLLLAAGLVVGGAGVSRLSRRQGTTHG